VIYLEDYSRDITGVYTIVKFGIFNGKLFPHPVKAAAYGQEKKPIKLRD
jgi:hypothetical protein